MTARLLVFSQRKILAVRLQEFVSSGAILGFLKDCFTEFSEKHDSYSLSLHGVPRERCLGYGKARGWVQSDR